MDCNNCRQVFEDGQEVFVHERFHCCTKKCCKEFEEKQSKQRSMFPIKDWTKAIYRMVNYNVSGCQMINVALGLKDDPSIQAKIAIPSHASVDRLKDFAGREVTVDIRREDLEMEKLGAKAAEHPDKKESAGSFCLPEDAPLPVSPEGRLYRCLIHNEASAEHWLGESVKAMTDDELKHALMDAFGPESRSITIDDTESGLTYHARVDGFRSPKFYPDEFAGEKPIAGKKLLNMVRDLFKIGRPDAKGKAA